MNHRKCIIRKMRGLFVGIPHWFKFPLVPEVLGECIGLLCWSGEFLNMFLRY